MAVSYIQDLAEVAPVGKVVYGGKGAGLVSLKSKGVNVPEGAIFSTLDCRRYLDAVYKGSEDAAKKAIAKDVNKIVAYLKGEGSMFPLVSVRSGAPVSMPGMMDTILNVGIDSSNFSKWVKTLGKECAEDCFLRLVEMYGSVVEGIPREEFDGLGLKDRLSLYETKTGHAFPNVKGQLLGAICAVFKSWNNERAIVYREENGIAHGMYTACVVQKMVFGNRGETSCTGVVFTADPSTGEPGMVGEFLVNAQGEDVVAGIVTPKKVSEMSEWDEALFNELKDVCEKLETDLGYPQDIEFTVEEGKLWILQTRDVKASAKAKLVLFKKYKKNKPSFKEFSLSKEASIDPEFKSDPYLIGIGASPGLSTGVVVKSVEAAINCKEPCILLSKETTPEDIKGMYASVGIVTARGGLTSHAAVVARGMNKVCVVGVGDELLGIEEGEREVS